MNKLANALGKDFVKKKDAVRTRSFVMGGHTFKTKIPLAAEFELMQEKMKELDPHRLEEYYKDLIKDLEKYRGKKDNTVKIEFLDDDVVLEGRSMKEAAKNKLVAEMRITEMFKLLVPEDGSFNMDTITYPMIEELFPFPIQMQVIEEISRVISPSYEAVKGK